MKTVRNNLLFLLVFVLSFNCKAQEKLTAKDTIFINQSQMIDNDSNVSEIDIADFDNDGINEKINVIENDEGERTLLILKYDNKTKKWINWYSFKNVILANDCGGMLGDPFVSATIQDTSIVIKHFGGSMDKWSYIHTYKYINSEWKLIKAISGYGMLPCFWETLYYDLVTGKVVYIKNGDEQCNHTFYKKTFYSKLEELPSMNEFIVNSEKNKVTIPDVNKTFFY